jgi:hypothetical protein
VLSNDLIHLNSSTITIKCQIDAYPFDAFYNPIVGVNIMSLTFAEKFLKDMPLIPTNKLLKNRSGHIIPSSGVLCSLPIVINEFRILLNFYIFDVWDFDVMIGLPIGKLLREGCAGNLDIKLGKGFNLSVPITHALKENAEPPPELDPIEEVKAVSFEEFIEPNLEDDTQFFIMKRRI